MTALATRRLDAWRPALLLGGLALAVTARWGVTHAGLADAVSIGLVFGSGVGALALAAGWRPGQFHWRPLALGAIGGLVLVGIAIVSSSSLPSSGPAPVGFAPWAVVTILVAVAEEALLRGVMFDQLNGWSGPGAAVAVTSLVFALMHVPLYGWLVVPLDFGVGVFLGGLRLATGGPGAPALAHAIADLATWWL